MVAPAAGYSFTLYPHPVCTVCEDFKGHRSIVFLMNTYLYNHAWRGQHMTLDNINNFRIDCGNAHCDD